MKNVQTYSKQFNRCCSPRILLNVTDLLARIYVCGEVEKCASMSFTKLSKIKVFQMIVEVELEKNIHTFIESYLYWLVQWS